MKRIPTTLSWVTLALSLTFFVITGNSANAQTRDDTGLWFAGFGNGKFESLENDSPLRWWLDTHTRFRNDSDGFNQSIVRPGIGYALNDDNAVWGGYGWIKTSPIAGSDFDEHRLWQQWTFSPSSGDWRFLHRSRFEQRWVETGDDVGFRWRQLARAQHILTKCPQWSLVTWDEAFFHLNDTDWGAESGFDQNRAFIGFGYKEQPNSRVRTEIGYLNQFVNRQNAIDGMNHILSVNFFY